jgi:PadR family transcriptional regulator PadR
LKLTQPSESEEWLDELVQRWTEVYKKSMTTLALLEVVEARGPIAAGLIGSALVESTGWGLTERGLYRTLRRLTATGLLTASEVAVPRTGAMRKDYELTPLGARYLARIRGELLDR